jgi:SAM-dependent methyltransferase
MLVTRVHTQEEFNAFIDSHKSIIADISVKEKELLPDHKEEFSFKGYSYPAAEVVDFKVDFLYSNGEEPNWRERVVCPLTNLNNRLRASIQFIDFELGIRDFHQIYISEQVTPLYQFLKPKYPELIGSEYLGPNLKSGELDNEGIRHEDMTNLSFSEEELDFYLSFECFEHIPDFNRAFKEAYRVLKEKGKLFFTVPFLTNSYNHLIRASIRDNGEIFHHFEPEYHGDPVNEEGALCFTHFGWKMLDDLRGLGFRDAYAILFWSLEFGYVGGHQIIFCVTK